MYYTIQCSIHSLLCVLNEALRGKLAVKIGALRATKTRHYTPPRADPGYSQMAKIRRLAFVAAAGACTRRDLPLTYLCAFSFSDLHHTGPGVGAVIMMADAVTCLSTSQECVLVVYHSNKILCLQPGLPLFSSVSWSVPLKAKYNCVCAPNRLWCFHLCSLQHCFKNV